MRPIDKADKLSTHFAKVNEDQIGDALAAAHEAVKNILNLPKDVKVSGLRFDLDDKAARAPNDGLCKPYCYVDSQGQTHCVYC